MAASSNGQVDRTVICYKDQNLDPTTIRWRDLTPPQPENALLGVLQNGTSNDRAFRRNLLFSGGKFSQYRRD